MWSHCRGSGVARLIDNMLTGFLIFVNVLTHFCLSSVLLSESLHKLNEPVRGRAKRVIVMIGLSVNLSDYLSVGSPPHTTSHCSHVHITFPYLTQYTAYNHEKVSYSTTGSIFQSRDLYVYAAR